MAEPAGGKISLDIRIPITWQVESVLEKMGNSDVTLKVQDKNENNKLISVVSAATKEGYDEVFTVAHQIISYNEEETEKIRLFNQKVEELKTLFLNSPLDKLKDISFKKPLNKDGLRNKKSAGEIGLGNQEGSGRDGSTETKIN
jgi:hypothetical protein